MKILNKEIDLKWIMVVAVLLVALLIIIFYSIPQSCQKKPPDMQAILNAAQEAASAPLKKEIANKDALIVTKQNSINALNKRIADKDRIIRSKDIVIKSLQREKENVKASTSVQDLRARFSAAGFDPLPENQCGSGIICFSTGSK